MSRETIYVVTKRNTEDRTSILKLTRTLYEALTFAHTRAKYSAKVHKEKVVELTHKSPRYDIQELVAYAPESIWNREIFSVTQEFLYNDEGEESDFEDEEKNIESRFQNIKKDIYTQDEVKKAPTPDSSDSEEDDKPKYKYKPQSPWTTDDSDSEDEPTPKKLPPKDDHICRIFSRR